MVRSGTRGSGGSRGHDLPSTAWAVQPAFLIVIALTIALCAPARAGERTQEIRVHLPPGKTAANLAAVHPDFERIGGGEGDVRVVSRPSLTSMLRAQGWRVEVIHDDLEARYASLQKAAADFGIWHTYAETVAELESLHAEFPAITTAPFSIGQSLEGREIWAIKVSDHPDVDEAEPEVLFDGVHHAREIMTVEVNLVFLRYLCERYGSDPFATHLVDDREIFIVPVVNPDGFVYNEQIQPGGGGMWRKNRRDNGNGTFGVDNNRNYPFQWGLGTGSSSVPSSETYRGLAPASEPENRAMIAFIEGRRFVTYNSFHSFLGAILMPWSYTPDPAPDDAILRSLCAGMTAESGYQFGQSPEILYLVSGGMVDWAYGEQRTKGKIYAFTTEIGGTGFWPAPSERDGLLAQNLPSMLYLAEAAGSAVRAEVSAVNGEDGNGSLDPGETVELGLLVSNPGMLTTTGTVTLHLASDDPYVLLERARIGLDDLGPGDAIDTSTDPFRFRIDPGCPEGRRMELTVEVRANDQTITLPVALDAGTPSALYASSFEAAPDAWVSDESQTATAGAFERIVPFGTPYQPGEDTTLPPGSYAWVTGQNTTEGDVDVDDGIAASRSPDFDLSGTAHARLSLQYFHGQRDGGDDPEGDFFSIDASSDAGASWVPLVSIGDASSTAVWRELEVDLEEVIDLTDRVRLRVRAADGPSDGDIVEAGIDDVRITTFDLEATRPQRPTVLSPADSEAVSPRPDLTILYPYPPGDAALHGGFRVFADADQTDLRASADGIALGAQVTTWRPATPLANGTYHWRAFVEDETQRSLYSLASVIAVNDSIPIEGEPLGDGPGLAAFPNPARDLVHLRVAVPPSHTSELSIVDAAGRRVRVLSLPPSASGWTDITWDGRDAAGRAVASGAYWVRLRTPGETRTLQLVRLR
jgi:hypothetical protein